MLRYKLALLAFAGMAGASVYAQELFVQSEPASNMPTHSIGIRMTNWVMDETATGRANYHLIPEVMWGASKDLMIHAEGFISNRSEHLSAEGVGVYAKYRFLSRDKVYRHFRMAAFGRIATNNADIHQEELQVNGHNTGYQAGLIATQLLHRTALSATAYHQLALNNMGGNEFPAGQPRQAVAYSLSAGTLLLPRVYTGYKQTNLNVMVELLGQKLLGNDGQFLDIAPSVQLIFNSQARLDVGYRYQLYSNMQRTAPNGLTIRLEYLLFGIA